MNKSTDRRILIRLVTIDKFLRKATDGYTLVELNRFCIEAVNYYDKSSIFYDKLSIFTTIKDLATLKGDKKHKKHYKAPIILLNEKYSYSDKKYSILNKPLPISKLEWNRMREILSFVEIYGKSFSYTLEINSSAANLTALIRYKTINDCLLDTTKKHTVKTLHSAALQALKERYPKSDTLSVETLHKDIYIMRSTKYGYNAPIVVKNKRYFYADPNYTITHLPIPFNIFIKKRLMKTLRFCVIYKENPFIKDLVASYNLDFTFNHILD